MNKKVRVDIPEIGTHMIDGVDFKNINLSIPIGTRLNYDAIARSILSNIDIKNNISTDTRNNITKWKDLIEGDNNEQSRELFEKLYVGK